MFTQKEIIELKRVKNNRHILWKKSYINAEPDYNKTKSAIQKKIQSKGQTLSYFENELLKYNSMVYVNKNKINYLLNRINKIKKQNKDLYSRISSNTCVTI